jgi:hypothetical protein
MEGRRRSTQTWESLLARLQPGWLMPRPEGKLIEQHARRPWELFCSAGVLLEMADFAARNAVSHDAVSHQELRRDAVKIRLYALKSLLHLA